MVRRILVPLDLAPPGEAKVPVAEEYARAFGAEVLLLHVLPPRALHPDEVLPAEASARAYLDVIIAEMAAVHVHAVGMVRSGPTAGTILAEARASHTELIILGTDVRPRLRSAVLGSIADAVVRNAPCPVLLVRPARGDHSAPPLRSFTEDAARSGPLQPRPLGRQTVGLGRIIGSVGRAHELGPDFRPAGNRHSDDQLFLRIRRATEAGADLPPVELYKLGYGYYVLDGHHRVAAAREVGQREIDAEVTEYIPLADPEAARRSAERRAFERSTGLTSIEASRPETYAKFVELIDGYRAEQGIADFRRAAQRWRSQVYRPLWQRIRERHLMRSFPGERPADLIARVGAWRAATAADGTAPVDWEEALERFLATLPEQPHGPPEAPTQAAASEPPEGPR